MEHEILVASLLRLDNTAVKIVGLVDQNVVRVEKTAAVTHLVVAPVIVTAIKQLRFFVPVNGRFPFFRAQNIIHLLLCVCMLLFFLYLLMGPLMLAIMRPVFMGNAGMLIAISQPWLFGSTAGYLCG